MESENNKVNIDDGAVSEARNDSATHSQRSDHARATWGKLSGTVIEIHLG